MDARAKPRSQPAPPCPHPDGSIEAGLWCLAQMAEPEECFTLEVIATAGGCSLEYIRQVEARALRKVKLKLGHLSGVVEMKRVTRENIV